MRVLICFILFVFGLYSNAQNEDRPEYLIKSIYFGGGSHSIDSVQLEDLYHFIDSIPEVEFYSISIHSHTDNIGGIQYNEWLSEMRGGTVINQLVFKELSPENIVTKDFGQFNPVYDNSTLEGRIRNRRVDIIFWPMVF
ncbi:MAG: OmpA family protein [Cytophagales bacterium]|nr:OmpA family protein [Cytophagales bacterium]